MPYQMSQAPPGTPEEVTIEYLLAKPNEKMDQKTLGELSDQQRSATGHVQLAKRCTRIPGDPFGLYAAWAGNVSHASDDRMPLPSSRRDAVQHFLAKVPNTEAHGLATESADCGTIDVVEDNDEEIVIDFKIESLSVRLMQCKDLNLVQKRPFEGIKRCRDALNAAKDAFDEPHMSIQIQQVVMARRLLRLEGSLNPAVSAIPIDDSKRRDQVLGDLRSEAREEYWLHSTKPQRHLLRHNVVMLHSPDVQRLVDIIQAHWPREWNNGRYDVDFFYHYLADKTAAEQVWELVDVDLFDVTDCNRRVVFANLENATGLVFDDDLAQRLADTSVLGRCGDVVRFLLQNLDPEL
ncbi:uncharacterized protein PG986_000099 [Apiospora aurea]|uniref:HNH nuclease domain-containing protein n=1 Tax=Apiospora aurea TaxID=335848 RepID=A0ABR1QTH2_9PEZI